MVLERMHDIGSNEEILTSLTIEILSHCNLKCVHCYIGDRKDAIEGSLLSYESVVKVLNEARALNVFTVTITGGEPLVHPEIHDIVVYAKSRNFIVILKSNGTLINKTKLPILKHVDCVVLSVYGFSKSTYESVTCVEGSYKQYKAALSLLKANNIKYEIRGVLLRENETESSKFIKNCSMVETYISSHMNMGYAHCHRPSDNHIMEVYKHLYSTGIPNKYDPDSAVCSVCTNSLTVNSRGEINPCANFHYSMGNIKSNTLSDAWMSDIKKLIKDSAKYRNLTKCFNCEHKEYSFLIGLCNNFVETGNTSLCSEETCRHCLLVRKTIEESRE